MKYLRIKYLCLKYLRLKYLPNSNNAICRYWKREHFSAIEHLKKLLIEHHPNEDISVRVFDYLSITQIPEEIVG